MPRTLVVDADHASRQVARMACLLAGHEVLEAADAIGALHVLDTFRPDLLVLSMEMPAHGSELVIKGLRTRQATLPILVLTGPLDDSEEETRAQYGVDRVLRRPLRINDISLAVRDMLNPALTRSASGHRRERVS